MLRGWFYRLVMRVAHRFDWHYAPIIGPFEDGSKQYWCKWCGLRQTIPPPDPWVSYKIGIGAMTTDCIRLSNIQPPGNA